MSVGHSRYAPHLPIFALWVVILTSVTWWTGGAEFRTDGQFDQWPPAEAEQFIQHFRATGAHSKLTYNSSSVTVSSDRPTKASAVRDIPLLNEQSVYRVLATVDSQNKKWREWTLRPTAVLSLYAVIPGQRSRFLAVIRPMFFQTSVSLDKLVEVPAQAKFLRMRLLSPEGKAWTLSKVTINQVKPVEHMPIVRAMLFALWIITTLAALYSVKRFSWLFSALFFLSAAVIAVGVLLNQASVVYLAKHLPLSTVFSGRYSTEAAITSAMDWAHLVLFFFLTLGMVKMTEPSRWRNFQLLMIGIGLAVITEVWQIHIPGRSSSISDLIMDISGIVLALVVYSFIGFCYAIFNRTAGLR